MRLVNIYCSTAHSWNRELKYQNVSKSANETVPAGDNIYEAYFNYKGSIDLHTVVSLADVVKLKDLICNYGHEVKYKFSLPEEYLGLDGLTNQNKFAVLDGSVVRVNTEWLGGASLAAVGRTPVVRVDASVNGVIVKSAYMKLMITE